MTETEEKRYLIESRIETFVILGLEFDITKAMRLIRARGGEMRADVNVTGEGLYSWLGWIWVDKELAMSDKVDLSFPILIASIRFKHTPDKVHGVPIDGYHRLYRAREEGLTQLPAWVLTERETYDCCISRRDILFKHPRKR